jgi:hypothetical protein
MTADRIAALEAQLNAAQRELALLKGTAGKSDLDAVPTSQAFANAPEKREVSIVPVLTETSALPDLKQTQRLFGIVKVLSPWPESLVDRYDDGRAFRGFSSCFHWIQNMPRADLPNGRRALSYWNDVCKNWLRDRNCMTGDVGANALILACFAAGDVCYTPGNSALGHTWEIGVVEYGGRPASADGWRRILREGASSILPPSAPARRMPAPSQVRIYGG